MKEVQFNNYMRINKMKDYYKDWSELDHYLGYKVTYSEYENTDYDNIKSDNPNDWSYQVYKASYQPKGYWGGSIISVEVSKKGVKFSRSSGGDIGDLDGLEQMTHFTKAVKSARLYAFHIKKEIERGNK